MRVAAIVLALGASASGGPVQYLLGNLQTSFAGVSSDIVDVLKADGPTSSLWPPWGRPPAPPKSIDLTKYTIGQARRIGDLVNR